MTLHLARPIWWVLSATNISQFVALTHPNTHCGIFWSILFTLHSCFIYWKRVGKWHKSYKNLYISCVLLQYTRFFMWVVNLLQNGQSRIFEASAVISHSATNFKLNFWIKTLKKLTVTVKKCKLHESSFYVKALGLYVRCLQVGVSVCHVMGTPTAAPIATKLGQEILLLTSLKTIL